MILTLGPFVLSLIRDQRRWLWWGAPAQRSADFHTKRAERLVSRIVSLGPTFVKLAQVFASRADLIPEPYLSQLGTLTDQVPPVPWTDIRATIAAEHGVEPEHLFEWIDQAPVAAASLGQVHRARWRGRDVAVKVLRPAIEATVARDLDSARAITTWAAQRWPRPHVIGFRSLVEEFEARISEEMDYRLEAEYATEVRANFAGNPRVVIPEVIHELTRRRVLVLEYVKGARVDQLRPGSVDASRLAGLVLEVYVQMMLVDGLFHADPHPGNLLLTSDGRLVLLDFGMMVRVSPELRRHLIRTVFASIRRDAGAVARGFYDLGLIAPGADPAEIARLSQLLVAMASSRTTTQQRLETMLADRVMKSLYDFPVILPRDLVYFARTAALIEGIGTRYDPYFNAVEVGAPVVMRMRSRILRSLGEHVEPGLEEIASAVGWSAGRLWRGVQEWVKFLLPAESRIHIRRPSVHRISTHSLGIGLLAAVSALFHPLRAQAPADERTRVIAVTDSALAAISRRDFVAFTDLMLDEAVSFSIRERDGALRYRARTRTEDRAQRPEGSITERGFQPDVRIAGGLATVWLPYDLYRDGKWSHCGVDTFTLLKVDGRWRIATMAWSVEQPPACAPHPDGPPTR